MNENMNSMIDIIRRRISIRTYDGKPLSADDRAFAEKFLAAEHRGPGGSSVRFALVDIGGHEDKKRFGTYGFISGAKSFVCGAVVRAPHASLDYGYCMEKVILRLTASGFGTCWLGGTFTRSAFADAIHLAETEMLPAITPVGHPASRSIRERVVRMVAGSDNRKPWADIFFCEDAQTPLTEKTAGDYADCLDCVRRAPSASNRQPWRVMKRDNRFIFLLARDRTYDSMIKAASLQEVDMGIAMSHFDLAAQAKGLKGSWSFENDVTGTPWEYMAAWRCG